MAVDILSGDKDLMQLITNSTTGTNGAFIHMVDPLSMTKVTHDTVLEKWGVPAHKLGDVLALAGDAADNIPGVPGIGPKIAAKLITEFETLEQLLAQTDQVPQTKRRENLEEFADQARMSQELVQLQMDISWDRMEMDPVEASSLSIQELRMEVMDSDRILAFYEEMGFRTSKERLLGRLQQQEKQSVAYAPLSTTKQQEKQPVAYAPSSTTKKTFTKKKSWAPKKKAVIPRPEDYKDVPF
jgi:DNA polymerase-1